MIPGKREKRTRLNLKRKANNLKLLMLFALIICCVGGVYAFWTQTLLAHNEFETAKYDTTLDEIFNSPDNWAPGVDTNKDVWVSNNGTVEVFTMAALNQKWTEKNSDVEKYPLIFKDGEEDAYAAQIFWGKDVVLLSSGRTSQLDLGLPLVGSIEAAEGKWLLLSDEPDANGNLTFYYIGMLAPGAKTPLLVDSVKMNPAIRPSVIEKKITYDETGEQHLEEIPNPTYSYEDARYTLLITASTVQATPSAVKSVFGGLGADSAVIDYFAEHGLSEDIF